MSETSKHKIIERPEVDGYVRLMSPEFYLENSSGGSKEILSLLKDAQNVSGGYEYGFASVEYVDGDVVTIRLADSCGQMRGNEPTEVPISVLCELEL